MITNGTLQRFKREPSLFSTFDDIFGKNLFFDDVNLNSSSYTYENNDSGGLLTVNAVGHDPENIDIEVTPKYLKINSSKPPGASNLVGDLNYTFTLNGKYSTDDIKAEFEHGLIKIKFGLQEEYKPKKLKLKY